MTDDKPTRRDLIKAQRAIFRNADEDERQGINWETDEYLDLHDKYWTLHRQADKSERRGVWNQAYAEHCEETGDAVHPYLAWGERHDGTWWRPREAER